LWGGGGRGPAAILPPTALAERLVYVAWKERRA